MICPKCKKEITHVNYECEATVAGTLDLEDGQHDFEEECDNKNFIYKCLECDAVITNAVNKAL